MTKDLLRSLAFVIILSSCASSGRQTANPEREQFSREDQAQSLNSGYSEIDTGSLVPDLNAGTTPLPLTDLPRTPERAFVLAPGFYETEFRSYCLQPGTPEPSAADAYFQAPLTGARKEIIASILHGSQRDTTLQQKHIQLLLWSVVSRSDFNKLPSEVQATGWQLLTQKQIFELRGGVAGLVKTVAQNIPSSGRLNDIQQLFERGVSSYEAYERLAMASGPSVISKPDFKRGQWYRHADGYYLRYFPNGYRHTKIQVFVPDNAVDTAAHSNGNYLVFDPASMIVVPANSNAQRLGVGAPVKDILHSVIKVITPRNNNPKPKVIKRETQTGSKR